MMKPLQWPHIDELYDTDTPLIRTLGFVLLVFVLDRINCMSGKMNYVPR